MPEILALIPARSGSKGIPDKNIRTVGGRALLVHSIEHALASRHVTRTIVSTDSAEYAELAKAAGAEVPFLRPAEFAQDTSTDLDVFQHALKWLQERGQLPSVCVHLRPTFPTRRVQDLDSVIEVLLADPTLDSVRSVVPAQHTPFKMWFWDDQRLLRPIVQTDIEEPYNQPRQALPPVYWQNACIDVTRSRVILEQGSMTGKRIQGYLMNDPGDIDTIDELKAVHHSYLSRKLRRQCTFCFDIGGIIATIVPDNDYRLAQPIRSTISMINDLFEAGHEILLFTTRSSATGIDWSDHTRERMREWGVKYHRLIFEKPTADFYIDDKLVSVDELANLLRDQSREGWI